MKFEKLALAIATSLVIIPSAFAQTADGVLGATSTGNVDVKMTVTDSVEITGLATLDFGSYGGGTTGDVFREEGYCVYVNGGDNYKITVTSTNGAATDTPANFFLVGAVDADQIMYTVKLGGIVTGSTLTQASASTAVGYGLTSDEYLGSKLRDCGSSDNAQIRVDIAEQEIRDATSGNYTDKLTLVLAPV
jgi:hypothetical protein